MDLVARNLIDVESDYYFINVAGITGKFIFDKNKNVLTIPEATYVVDDSDFPNGFTITADDGTVYEFFTREQTVTGPEYFETFALYLVHWVGFDRIHTLGIR